MGLAEFLIIAGLVFINGFFVAAEFALVKVRTSQIDQLAEQGNWAAKLTSKALDRLDAYLSASQLGITVASLALGKAIEDSIEPGIRVLLHRVGIPEARWHRRHDDALDRAGHRALVRDVPAHGAGRAGPQEPGHPLGQDRRPLDRAPAGRLLLRLLADHLAAEHRQQPDALAPGPGRDRPRRGLPTPKKSCGTSSPRASPAATSRATSGS